tara:strand:- start:9 stop:164 length:156 start_codon:yes stop_codon:yes gene_type:complete
MTEYSLETSVPDGGFGSCSGKLPGLSEQNVLSKLDEVINGGIQTTNPSSPN